jgi:hypothetical protein
MSNLEKIHLELMNQIGMSEVDYFKVASIITPEILYQYLNYAYVTGFNEGMEFQRKKHSNNMAKPVIMIKNGIEVNRFDTCKAASKFVGRAKNGITEAIKKNRKCAGYNFRYV